MSDMSVVAREVVKQCESKKDVVKLIAYLMMQNDVMVSDLGIPVDELIGALASKVCTGDPKYFIHEVTELIYNID